MFQASGDTGLLIFKKSMTYLAASRHGLLETELVLMIAGIAARLNKRREQQRKEQQIAAQEAVKAQVEAKTKAIDDMADFDANELSVDEDAVSFNTSGTRARKNARTHARTHVNTFQWFRSRRQCHRTSRKTKSSTD